MGHMVIETFPPNPEGEEGGGALEDQPDGRGPTEGPTEVSAEGTEVAPDSPSKQLPDQISFFSGNPSVQIVHGIMHLFKTNKMTSLTEDVRCSAMLCILTVPSTMTSHDLVKFVAPFYDVMEHMKIIRDSTPNQYMVLIKFSSQADADSFYTACNGRTFNSIIQHIDHQNLVIFFFLNDDFWNGQPTQSISIPMISSMKAKFKETIDRYDNLERRLGELAKDEQSMDKKCGQLSTRVTKLGQELKEKQEMNRCLRANQVQLQAQLAEDEHKARETVL